jgi:phosphatidylserine/phosphatidylglycerophosphate/cardiolipin synthase-like enzyme
MFSPGAAVGNVQPYFLTQAEVDLDRSAPLEQQPGLQQITGQALQMAGVLADFIGGAAQAVDIAIYDFRLLGGALTDTIVSAVRAAAGRGVAIRLAYDKVQESTDAVTLKAFADAGGDPAPVGTQSFIEAAALPSLVQARPIEEEAIDPGHQIMHQKYLVRDPGTPDAAVLMGSANFTTDAWGIQDNNVLVITGAPDLAAAYERDFDDLWTTQRLARTGTGDIGSVQIGDGNAAYSFAPGEGRATEDALAELITSAATSIRVASMVISSGKILQALANQINAGRDLAGVYDGPEMHGIVGDWQKSAGGTSSAQHLALWQTIAPHLTAKQSLPFTATGPHNFMHNKAVVADGTIATGSFNFSANATRNAENVLRISSADLATQYTAYVDGLVHRYGTAAVPG